jgi:hypothetical protein
LTRAKRAITGLCALLLVSLACSFFSIIEGVITVPPAVQEQFSAERPGLVLIEGDSGRSSDVLTVGQLPGPDIDYEGVSLRLDPALANALYGETDELFGVPLTDSPTANPDAIPLPALPDRQNDDWFNLVRNYNAEVAQQLEALAAAAFTPDIALLDALLASLRVDPEY